MRKDGEQRPSAMTSKQEIIYSQFMTNKIKNPKVLEGTGFKEVKREVVDGRLHIEYDEDYLDCMEMESERLNDRWNEVVELRRAENL